MILGLLSLSLNNNETIKCECGYYTIITKSRLKWFSNQDEILKFELNKS